MMQSRALRDVKSAISGETWAIVYAYESPRRPRHLWYDRWRYDVLNDYVQAASILGAEPYILDIDQFIISDALRRGDFDFVVNLNSGATPISNLGLVPSLAQWHQTPCFPNTADVILAGERKDICKRVFATWFKVPRDADSLPATSDATLIRKPRTMGNSQGVTRCNKVQGGGVDDFFEEFIAGYDVTIPVYYDIEIGDYVVAAAVAYFPEVSEPRQWFLSYDEKMRRSGSIERRLMGVDDSLRQALLDASREFRFQSVARYDFRWAGDASADCVRLDDLWFLEINCLPTLCTNVNFLMSIKAHIKGDPLECGDKPSEDVRALAFLLAHARGRQDQI